MVPSTPPPSPTASPCPPGRWIAWGQRPRMTIVTAAEAAPSEAYAAAELRHYLNLIASVSLPVATGQVTGPVLAVGQAAADLGVSAGADLGADGFTLRTVGDSLAIVGGPRGVIYGVYELLERLGCRFFTPLAEQIPSRPDLALPDLDETQIPVLEYRQHNYTDFARYPRFAVKSRLNAGHLPPEYGGGMSYAWFVHTFEPNLISPDEYYDSHPEYFSLVNGVRVRERAQPCLSHPDVLRITIAKVTAALRAHPECRLISVSQNDWDNHCTCDGCSRLDTAEESSAGSLIWFVNQVAEAIEAEFPQVIVDTLAYQYSRPAPRHIRPRHNVCVRLCSIEACFAHPFATCDDPSRWVKRPDGTASSFIRDLRDWGQVCGRMYIWDYTTCFAHYPAPHPNWNVLQPNMQAFVRNNVKGVFEQACGAYGGGVDLNELRAYLITRLLWDANCDLERHMSEFLSFYYGAAAPYIGQYIRTLTAKVEADNIHIGFNDQCDRAHLTDDMLAQYDALFDAAEGAVRGDPVRGMRVARARLAIRWVRLKNDAMLQGRHSAEEITRFFTDWRAHGLTRIDEWVSAETTHRALIENVWRGTEFYRNWWEEGGERL